MSEIVHTNELEKFQAMTAEELADFIFFQLRDYRCDFCDYNYMNKHDMCAKCCDVGPFGIEEWLLRDIVYEKMED